MDSEEEGEAEVADLEDLGGPAKQARAKGDGNAASAASTGGIEPKQMLSPPLRAALSKQGYKLVGAAPLHILQCRHRHTAGVNHRNCPHRQNVPFTIPTACDVLRKMP